VEQFYLLNVFRERSQSERKNREKNHQIKTLLNLSNIPKRYNQAIFKPKTAIQNEVAEYFIENFTKFKESEILILDEIGKRVLADWQRIQLEEILSHRYNEQLPTIYITNLEQEAFQAFLGVRLADRLR